MENLGTYFKMAVAGLGTIITYLFGGWSSILGILLAFVITDYITGWMAARYTGKLSSSIGFKGIAKKILIFAIVAMANLIDQVLGTDMIMNATIYFYLANELLSFTENVGRMGVDLPPAITKAIAILNEKGGTENVNHTIK